MNTVFDLPVGIIPGFLPSCDPDLEGPGVGFLDLIDQPVLDFPDQQALLFAEENEVGLLALFPDGRFIPADKILVRPGRFPEICKVLKVGTHWCRNCFFWLPFPASTKTPGL